MLSFDLWLPSRVLAVLVVGDGGLIQPRHVVSASHGLQLECAQAFDYD